MYGQEPQTQLAPTYQQVYPVFPRYANFTRVVRFKRYRSKSVDSLIGADPHEASEEWHTRSNQQWGLVCRSTDDGKIRRSIEKRRNKSSERVNCRWFHCTNSEAQGWESTTPIRCYMPSYIRDQRQRVHSANHKSITRLPRQNLKWCPSLCDLESLREGLNPSSQQWCPSEWDANEKQSIGYSGWNPTIRDPL